MWNVSTDLIGKGDKKSLSRAISLIENEAPGYHEFLKKLVPGNFVKVIGITGPAGSGKSTIVDGLIGEYVGQKLKVAVICIDPSSSFTGGAILGDRVRMREWYNHKSVYIRSMATRGSWGGLNASIIEVTDLLRCAGYDRIIIETVGVGQTEIEVASLADTTIVVQVPEAGDDIQAMKAGLMEVADIFAVNKCDRPAADEFISSLRGVMHDNNKNSPIIKLVALQKHGINELACAIDLHEEQLKQNPSLQAQMLTRKAIQLLLKNKLRSIDKKLLADQILIESSGENFNLYKFVEKF